MPVAGGKGRNRQRSPAPLPDDIQSRFFGTLRVNPLRVTQIEQSYSSYTLMTTSRRVGTLGPKNQTARRKVSAVRREGALDLLPSHARANPTLLINSSRSFAGSPGRRSGAL